MLLLVHEYKLSSEAFVAMREKVPGAYSSYSINVSYVLLDTIENHLSVRVLSGINVSFLLLLAADNL